MKVTNRPRTRALRIPIYRPYVWVAGRVRVAVAPQNGACLASGFGKRWGRLHKGLDYHGRPAPMIHAAAPGVVREATFHQDYGNMVLIDHGHGVFTRYAHLRSLTKTMAVGRKVSFGTPVGRMGRTAKVKLPLHLHYEILVGKYDNPKKSFGLRPVNPFRLLARARRPNLSLVSTK
ncbi:MAG: M23 family metallopeptidase [Myxococcota bacterium]